MVNTIPGTISPFNSIKQKFLRICCWWFLLLCLALQRPRLLCIRPPLCMVHKHQNFSRAPQKFLARAPQPPQWLAIHTPLSADGTRILFLFSAYWAWKPSSFFFCWFCFLPSFTLTPSFLCLHPNFPAHPPSCFVHPDYFTHPPYYFAHPHEFLPILLCYKIIGYLCNVILKIIMLFWKSFYCKP
jgi:hypothetical protein